MLLPKHKRHDLLICNQSVILLRAQSDNSLGLRVQSSFILLQVSRAYYCQVLLSFSLSQIEPLCQSNLLTASDTFFNLSGIFVESHRLHALQCVEF